MAKDRQSGGPVSGQLDNYDLTRKLYAVRNLELMTRLSEAEAAKPTPNLSAIAELGVAISAVLSSVG